MAYMRVNFIFATLLFIAGNSFAQNGIPDLRKTALKSTTPSDEIVRLDINKDGKPDILERWWNGKRVRWLDENDDMIPTDTRGDQIADVMQIDKNGDGIYDSATRYQRQVGRQRRRWPRRYASVCDSGPRVVRWKV